MKSHKSSGIMHTPLAIIIAIAAIVLVTELLLMALLHEYLEAQFELSPTAWGFIDAILLTFIVAPALYLLVFRKLQQSEARIRQINAAAQDAIVIVDAQGGITSWNPAAQRLFQYRAEEALGQQLHRLIAPPRLQADADRGFAHFAKTGEGPIIGKTIEIVALRKDGSEFPVELSISARKLNSHWQAIGIARDITERRQAEEALRKSEESFRQLVEKSPDIVYRFSNKRGGIFYSERAIRVLGYSLEHLYAHPMLWNESIHPEDALKVTEITRQAAEKGVSFDIEYRIRNAQGQWLWLHDRSMRIDEAAEGEVIIEGLAMDITERKLTETRLAEYTEELRRWHDITLGRELRNIELKREINELLKQAGQPPRYPSAEPEEGKTPDV